MELVLPQLGLFFWTLLIFTVFFFILRAVAWKPILAALRTREEGIEAALKSAEAARAEMATLTANNEKLLNEARTERAAIIQEAQKMKDKIIAEAREQAGSEMGRKVREAEAQIASARMAAVTEIKNLAGNLAVEIAEKLLRRELAQRPEQDRLIQQALDEVKLN